MSAGVRGLGVCLLCCVGLWWTGVADAEVMSSGELSPLGSVLVVPGSLTEVEQMQAAEEAKLASPEVVAEREASQTAFSGLDSEQAAKLAGEAFPVVIDDPAGGPPKLPAGQSITGYPTDNSALVDLGAGGSAVVESIEPLAIESSAGQRTPVDLSLSDVGGAFEPKTPVVGVRIPRRLGEGVALMGAGVSLTPADAQGVSLGGVEGVVDGASVLYADTQTDADTVVKPTTAGFEADTMLRSAASPRQLYFRVGLPVGAHLVQEEGAGPVQIVKEGVAIATIPDPGAKDAAGTSVPLQMSVSGDLLALSVGDGPGEYQFPIAVDPEVKGEDSQLVETTGGKRSNWKFQTSSTVNFGHEPNEGPNKDEGPGKGYLETSGTAEYKESEKAFWAYQTKGVSKIYEFNAKTEGKNKGAGIESFLELEGSSGPENKYVLSTETKTPEYGLESAPPLCAKNGTKVECAPAAGAAGNVVRFQQSVQKKPSNYKFSDSLHEGVVYLAEPEHTHSSTKFNTEASGLEGEVENAEGKKEIQHRANALYGTSTWLSHYWGAIEPIASDPGIGVAATKLEYEATPGKWESIAEHNYLTENACEGVQCYPSHGEYWTLNSRLANGEDKIRYRAEEALGTAEHLTESPENEEASTKTVKVDTTAPYRVGLLGLPYGNELSERTYELTAAATDGQGTTASSGVGSIEVYVDKRSVEDNEAKEIKEGKAGKEPGSREGECSVPKGECSASASFSLKGQELGAGHHSIVIIARDKAHNEARHEEQISIRHSTPVALGPGSVDLQSGDFTLAGTDVSLGSGLTVSRAYSSRSLTAGTEGPLGPQWSMSTGNTESLTEMVDYGVLMTAANGSQTIFAAILNSERQPTGQFESPPGDSNLTLKLEENKETKVKEAYYLEDAAAHTKVKFTLPSGGGKSWVPTKQEGAVATDTVTYTYQAVEVEGRKITRPTEALAPHVEVSCAPKMEPGCRALKFTYATETTAKGENESEWGDYNGRLKKISYEGYNPATKKMTEASVAVAEYSYDKKGRLRAEWDPRISPVLKTIYGYDAEGHVTALTPAGQESWAFTYGTIPGDEGTGRLLKATQAPATAPLYSGYPPKLLELEGKRLQFELSGSPAVGNTMGISTGYWSPKPVAYSYQWEDCNAPGGFCTPIPGAHNPNYTVTNNDVGQTLTAVVTATNGGGSVSASESVSIPIAEHEYAFASYVFPEAITKGPDGNLWFTEGAGLFNESKIGKMTTAGVITEYTMPPETDPRDITAGPDGNLWFTSHSEAKGVNKIGKITTAGVVTEYKLPHETTPVCITAGPDGNLWFTADEYKIGKITTAGVVTEYAVPAELIQGITEGPDKNLWFTNVGDSKIGKITTAGAVTEYPLPAGSRPARITPGPDGNLWFTDNGTHKVGKITTSGTITEYELASETGVYGITQGPDGNLWVTEEGGPYRQSKIGKITTAGAVTEYPAAKESGPNAITQGADKNLWFMEYKARKIGKINLNPTEGTHYAPSPGTTVEYNVPLAGTGAPHEMGANKATGRPEPERWAQKDDPVEATAIIPPDSPQGWPASSYKRATVYYLDEQGRNVNVAQPSSAENGAIATTEYNEFNDVVRTLSPDNRNTALKEPCESESNCQSATLSKLLDTQNTYNGEGAKEGEVAEPGTQLIETVGPEHMVKYVSGEEQYEPGEKPKEAMARSYTRNYYNEGAPSESETHERYDLLTKTENYAELASPTNRERKDVRTTLTSYSGQSKLGWKLRAPTSVTTNPGSLKQTTTTVYNETTGQITETRGPAAEGTFTYASKFGETGSEAGKLKGPTGVAIDSKGDIWVADEANSRIEEFGPAGEYLSTFGKTGKEAGQLKEPKGIAIDSKGNLWVAEAGNNRVQEFSPEGKSLQTIGKEGSENGQLKEPNAVAIDSKGNVWVADTTNNRIEEFSTEGKYVQAFGKAGSEPGQLKEPKGIAIDAKGNIWVADTGNNRIQEFSAEGKLVSHSGESGTGAGQFNTPAGLAFDGAGHLWVADEGNSRVQELATSGAFITQIGSKGSEAGQLNEPRAVAFAAQGEVWVTDTANNRLEKYAKGPNAHDTKVVYYGPEENKAYPNCGKHPEWAGLICASLPTKQPELSGLPKLPVTTTTYNMWNEPETIEEKFVHLNPEKHEETSIRTKKRTYDEAGRLKTSETTATGTADTALPKVTDEYNSKTGLLEKESTTVAEKTSTVTTKRNTLGQAIEYIDADGNVAKYKYAGPEGDGLLEELSTTGKGASYQKYTYEETTKTLTQLVDSAAGTFTANYDAEGRLTSEIYPNGMCANYTTNAIGEATGIEYIKTTNCSESKAPVWFSETRTPAVRGETMSRTNTLTSDAYSYDQSGRLTSAQEEPAGQGCTSRVYAYDEGSNRMSLTTRKPGSKGECTTEGGTVEAHNYDEAGRLTDPGIEYDSFANVTKLPASDAETHELKSTFYVDNAVATQEQNGTRNEYFLDPAGRVRETITGTKKTITHYDAPGEGVAWSCEKPSGSETCETATNWTRNIPGIDGTLTAIQTNGGTPVLQLHDLQGDIVATAALSSSETKLLSTYNSTEFGVPNSEKAPPPYAWLGAGDVASSLPSGVITYGATSYVPQTGQALQSEQVEPPGAPNGSGGGAKYTDQLEPWVMQGATREASEAPGIGATEEREAWEAALASAEDPTFHYRAWQAKERAEKLLRVVAAGELLEGIRTIFGDLGDAVDGIIEAKWSTEVVFNWMEEYGQFLDACVRELHQRRDSHGGCRGEYHNLIWEGSKVPDFWEKPLISYCLRMSSDTVVVHECTLEAYREDLPPMA